MQRPSRVPFPVAAIPLLVGALLLSAACASLRGQFVGRRCSDTPQNAVATFIEGTTEFLLSMGLAGVGIIRSVVLPGISLRGVFADGDAKIGEELLRQMIRYPGVLETESSVGMPALTFVRMENGGDSERRVIIQREDTVYPPDGEGVTKLYERAFLVRFEPNSNCITRVSPAEAAWRPVPSDRP